MTKQPRILVIGAGPTGLGAAYRLHELGQTSFQILERNDYPGGLATSLVDEKGFTWDIGGHVQFSHYCYFDRAMDRAMGQEWLTHSRQSHIWISDRFVPYPFQNNLRYLPEDQVEDCVRGLLRTHLNGHALPANFSDWILFNFGEGIANLFLYPYNLKVWAHPLDTMSYSWIGERVATVSAERAIENIALQRDDIAWGPNSTFRFPSAGGTGAIWRAVAAGIPQQCISYKEAVIGLDVERQIVRTSCGRQISYDVLISTAPLDLLAQLARLDRLSGPASRLAYSTTHVVGIGLRGAPPDHLRHKNWMYFPERNCPFYRLTVFSNYSPRNAPAGHWSLMAEVSESRFKPVDRNAVIAETIAGLRDTGMVSPWDEIASTWLYTADRGYPVPSTSRDDVLNQILPDLEKHNIYSRGRFGAWKYEVANQDHSFMQGVEVVNRVLRGEPETTINGPN